MLTPDQYTYLLPHRAIIKHVAEGGNTSDGTPWWAMNTINIQCEGGGLRSGCSACMVEDYQRYWNMMMEYENQNVNG